MSESLLAYPLLLKRSDWTAQGDGYEICDLGMDWRWDVGRL